MEKGNNEKFQKGRMMAYLFCAAGTLILLTLSFVSFGWFTGNKTVDGDFVDMKAVDGIFELAAVGTNGLYDAYLDADDGEQLSGIVTENDEIINPSSTDDGRPEIKWLMSDDSNFGNLSGGGIQPGSCGKLSFYVISRQDADLDLVLSIDTILYDKNAEPIDDVNTDNSDCIIPETEAEARLVKGHILFFEKYDEASGVYSGRITDKFYFTRENAAADTAYKVDFYWVWPEVIDQLLLPNDDDLLFAKGHSRITQADDAVITESEAEHFFSENIDGLAVMLDNVSNGSADASFSRDFYDLLNAKWNEADQTIGTGVGYIELTLTADVRQAEVP